MGTGAGTYQSSCTELSDRLDALAVALPTATALPPLPPPLLRYCSRRPHLRARPSLASGSSASRCVALGMFFTKLPPLPSPPPDAQLGYLHDHLLSAIGSEDPPYAPLHVWPRHNLLVPVPSIQRPTTWSIPVFLYPDAISAGRRPFSAWGRVRWWVSEAGVVAAGYGRWS